MNTKSKIDNDKQMKKQRICHVIMIIISVIFCILIMHLLWFRFCPNKSEQIITLKLETKDKTSAGNKDELQKVFSLINRINEKQNSFYSNYISIERLSGFYETLFAIMAIFLALVGFTGWSSISDLKQKLRKFEDVEKRVEFLYRRKELAEKVKLQFDIERKEYTFALDMDNDERIEFGEIKDYIINEHEDHTWLELFIAHELVTVDHNFNEAEKIYNFIEFRNLFGNSRLEALLYHFKAQLYQSQFSAELNLLDLYKRDNFLEQNQIYDAFVDYEINQNNVVQLKNLLKKSIDYYEKALEAESDNDQTHGNLAVTQIAMFKLERLFQNQTKYWLIEANKHLNEVEKIKKKKGPLGYNFWWDKARVLYYLNTVDSSDDVLIKETNQILSTDSCFGKITNSIKKIINRSGGELPWDLKMKELLRFIIIDKVVNEVLNNSDDASNFLEKVKEESSEYNGFPGDKNLILECEKKLS